MCNGSRCTIGKGVLDASCAPGEATCRDLIQLVGDLYRHHAVEHEKHFVLIGVHAEIRSRRERR